MMVKGSNMREKIYSKFPSWCIILKSNGNPKTIELNNRGFKTIKEKGLFDSRYYLQENPDIRESGIDPLLHYMFHGFKEGRNPSPSFDNDYYLNENPDVSKSGLSPLVHYSLTGQKELRKIAKDQKLKVMDINVVDSSKYNHKIIEVTLNQPIKPSNEWIELFNAEKEQIPIKVEYFDNGLYMIPIEPLSQSNYTVILHTYSITDMDENPILLYLRFLNVDTNLYSPKKDVWHGF